MLSFWSVNDQSRNGTIRFDSIPYNTIRFPSTVDIEDMTNTYEPELTSFVTTKIMYFVPIPLEQRRIHCKTYCKTRHVENNAKQP